MNFFTGFLVGIVSLIPGISGGTILVILNQYENITKAINNFKEKKYIKVLLIFILGIFLGAITFARILELFLKFFPNETMTFFSGLILFELPHLIKKEKTKPNIFWFSCGIFLIFSLALFCPSSNITILNIPNLTPYFLIFFCFCGAIDGFFTILPGISGSMIMMILGPYFLYQELLAKIDFQHLQFFLPLLFYLLGDAIGFFLGSKFSIYFFKHHRNEFMSCIFGMILASILIIFPIPDINNIFSSLIILIFSLLLDYILP